MAAWLYPITETKKKTFDLENGKNPIPVTIRKYEEIVCNGKIREDPWWGVSFLFDKIEINDQIFIHTGFENRGIIGFATVIHKEGTKKKPWHMKLDFDLEKCKMLIEQPVPAEVVKQLLGYNPRNAVTDIQTIMQELNVRLPWNKVDSIENKIKDLIETNELTAGQGYANNQAVKKAVEIYAMERATAYYQRLGHQVQDVSLNSSYDLHCVKDHCKLLVEVKGTTNGGTKVILTKNEVINAQNNKGQVSLFILHSIKIDIQGDKIEATGGTELVINPWDIDTGTLTAMTYEYQV